MQIEEINKVIESFKDNDLQNNMHNTYKHDLKNCVAKALNNSCVSQPALQPKLDLITRRMMNYLKQSAKNQEVVWMELHKDDKSF